MGAKIVHLLCCHFVWVLWSLTSAVRVAFGAKPWPGLIDTTCRPVGTLHLGPKVMEAWPGRNSMQIQNKSTFYFSTDRLKAVASDYSSEKRKQRPASQPVVRFRRP